MPPEGMPWMASADILTDDEIERLTGIFLSLGVQTVRITGGEPLTRPGLSALIARLTARGITDLALTTNGLALAGHASDLAAAGLRRINVSVDSLLRHRFEEMTRRDGLERVMAGLRAAEDAGLSPIKLNCVVIRGTNDDELVDFARFSRDTGYEVRFIEFMPLDEQRAWRREDVVGAREILDTIDAAFPLEPIAHGPEPATMYRFADGAPGAIGVIPSVTDPFCGSCNRIRITADGAFRTCLFALEETDLRGMLRAGATDDDLVVAIRRAVAGKWAGHRINESDFVRPARSMSAIGG